MSDVSPKTTDKRQHYLKKLLEPDGYHVAVAEELSIGEQKALFSQAHPAPFLFLLPVPASKDRLESLKTILSPSGILFGGNLPKDFTDFCLHKNVTCIDYMQSETVAMGNAVATAEGIIAQAVLETPENLHGSKALVIGFGKCGEILAAKLNALHVQVFVSTRNPLALTKAKCYGYCCHEPSCYAEYDLIFNTAPAMVLTKDIIDQLNPDVFIFDIASKPGGTDFTYCEKKGIHAKLYPGLPGKHAPKASARIIYEYIKSSIL